MLIYLFELLARLTYFIISTNITEVYCISCCAVLVSQNRAPHDKNWVVYCEKPFKPPENVIAYLVSYTHRVAISNQTLEPPGTSPCRRMHLYAGSCCIYYLKGSPKTDTSDSWPSGT